MKTCMRSAALALAAALIIPTTYAGPFDDIAQSISKAASDTLGNAANSLLNGASSGSASPKLGGSPSVGAGNVTQGVAPQTSSGSLRCISQKISGYTNHIQNTCSDGIYVLIHSPRELAGRCEAFGLGPGKTHNLPSPMNIVAICRARDTRLKLLKLGDCQCPSGTDIGHLY